MTKIPKASGLGILSSILLPPLPKLKPLPNHRSLPRKYAPAIRHYAMQVGEVTWAWNRLHGQFHILFAVLIDPDDLTKGIKMWHAIKSDDAQRSLLEATAKAKLTKRKGLLKRVLWTITQAGKLAAYRNDATHTPVKHSRVGRRLTTVPEAFLGFPIRVERLARVGHARLFKLTRGDLLQLSGYCGALWAAARHPELDRPLPRKPKMQAIQLVEKSKRNPSNNPPPRARSLRRAQSSPS